MSAARIGKITLKNGGAVVRLLRQETPNAEGTENWAGRLAESAHHAVSLANQSGAVTGYMMAVFYGDHTTWFDFRWGEESPMNRALLPSYIAEVVRRDMLMEWEAARKFDEMFERT